MDDLRRDIYRIHEHDNLDENCIDCEHFYREMKKIGYSRRPELDEEAVMEAIPITYSVRNGQIVDESPRNSYLSKAVCFVIAKAICAKFKAPTADVNGLVELLRDWDKFAKDVRANDACGHDWLDELKNRTNQALSNHANGNG